MSGFQFHPLQSTPYVGVLVSRSEGVSVAKFLSLAEAKLEAKSLSIAKIQNQVARFYHIHPDLMTAPSRDRAHAHPRQIAMYLSRKLTRNSLPEIGRRFGGRDHTTVLHGVREVERRMQSDRELAREVRFLSAQLRGTSE